MTYHDQLLALGDEVDSKIASVTTNPKTTAHADEGGALGLQWDQAVAAAKPPAPPPTKTLYGVSCGDNVANTVNLVHPKRMRCYNQSQLAACKSAGVHEFHHSEKPNLTALGNRDTGTMNTLRTQMLAVEAGRVTVGHETDNDTAFSKSNGSPNQQASVVYQKAWTVFLEIVAGINAARDAAHKLITVDVTTGVLYRNGVPEWWIVQGAAEHGIDIYDPHNFQLVYDKLQSLGYSNWSLPETGYQAGTTMTTSNTRPTDDQMLARQQSDVKWWSGLAHPPKSVFIFNNNDSQFQDRPKTAAYISSLCAQG